MISAILRSMRPKQWTKNGFVFAGYLFTIDQNHDAMDLLRVVVAFVLFCAVSGAVYIFNDVVDVENDKRHPTKSARPIAEGGISISLALAVAAIISLAALCVAFRLGLSFGLTVAGYIALTTLYTLKLKHIVIIDLLSIAAGFVIRAIAGAVVISVTISPWLLLCTTLLALFLGLAKRRDELTVMKELAPNLRKTLKEYSVEFIDQMTNITAAAVIMAYSLYTFAPFSKTGSKHPYLMMTIPFVIYGMFRYLYLVHAKGCGGQPEQVIVEDRPLLINILLWAIASAIILKWDTVAAFVSRVAF